MMHKPPGFGLYVKMMSLSHIQKGIIRWCKVPWKTELVKHKWYNERHTCRCHDVPVGESERKRPLWYLPRKGFPKNGQFRTCVEQRTFSENPEILFIHLCPSQGYVRVPLPRPSNNNITDSMIINSITNFAHLSPSQGCVGVPGPPAIVSGDHNNGVVHQSPVLQVDEHLEYHTRRRLFNFYCLVIIDETGVERIDLVSVVDFTCWKK